MYVQITAANEHALYSYKRACTVRACTVCVQNLCLTDQQASSEDSSQGCPRPLMVSSITTMGRPTLGLRVCSYHSMACSDRLTGQDLPGEELFSRGPTQGRPTRTVMLLRSLRMCDLSTWSAMCLTPDLRAELSSSASSL
jgi:hypothetical protein